MWPRFTAVEQPLGLSPRGARRAWSWMTMVGTAWCVVGRLSRPAVSALSKKKKSPRWRDNRKSNEAATGRATAWPTLVSQSTPSGNASITPWPNLNSLF